MSATTVPAQEEPHEPASGDLTLVGALTVRNIRQIHDHMRDVLRQHAHMRIDCQAASDIDLSFIQLVLAARRSAEAEGKSVSLAHPASGVLLERLTQSGLVGPDANQAEQVFWFRKEIADGKDHPHGG
jgi:ABC-type transporter Mla MlaB component